MEEQNRTVGWNRSEFEVLRMSSCGESGVKYSPKVILDSAASRLQSPPKSIHGNTIK